MDKYPLGRRDFLMNITAWGAAGLPVFAQAVRSRPVSSADGAAGANTRTTYDPAATFEIKVSEVELRRTRAGRTLMARIYQPTGAGPFPTVLDLHGGAWNAKDPRRGTDGPRAGGKWRARGCDRHDAFASSRSRSVKRRMHPTP